MKETTTISFSIPKTLAVKVDKLAELLNISRSALLTAIISFLIKWVDEGEKNNDLENLLNR